VEVATTIHNVSTLFYRSTRLIHPAVLEPASYKKIMKTFSANLLPFFFFFFYSGANLCIKSTLRILWSRFQYVVDGVRVFAIKRVCRISLLYLNYH